MLALSLVKRFGKGWKTCKVNIKLSFLLNLIREGQKKMGGGSSLFKDNLILCL